MLFKRQNQEKKARKGPFFFSLPFPFLASWDMLGSELYGLYGQHMRMGVILKV
jgi:hypothetical protein